MIKAAPPESVARSVRLGAALFNGDHARLGDEIARLEAAGLDFVHFDVFDGYFVSDIGFAPRTIGALRALSKLPFEVHLGVSEPLRFIPQLAAAGVDLILPHIESLRMAHETISAIRRLNMRAGITVGLGTSLSTIEGVVDGVDSILLLSRVAGEGAHGATFDSRVLSRLLRVRELLGSDHGRCDVQVAGGVNRTNVAELAQSGADSLALGAGIYKSANMRGEVDEIRRTVARALSS